MKSTTFATRALSASSFSRRAAPTLRAKGFSVKTAFARASASPTISSCAAGGVATATASKSADSNISQKSP